MECVVDVHLARLLLWVRSLGCRGRGLVRHGGLAVLIILAPSRAIVDPRQARSGVRDVLGRRHAKVSELRASDLEGTSRIKVEVLSVLEGAVAWTPRYEWKSRKAETSRKAIQLHKGSLCTSAHYAAVRSLCDTKL